MVQVEPTEIVVIVEIVVSGTDGTSGSAGKWKIVVIVEQVEPTNGNKW